ncbi:glutathione S-transferase [Suillus ampliporus]|nr:glutathione S-transferase [Suillus ampliporus]
MSSTTDSGKVYHRECTGPALETVQQHAHDQDITLFAGCFCPFVQRVWAALEYLQIPYKYYEVDPYQKPQELLNVSPKGLVPALMLNAFNPPRALNESTCHPRLSRRVRLIASKSTHRSLFPPDPYAKALVRLQSDHINRTLVPAFYRYLQAQDPEAQISGEKEFHVAIQSLVELFERAEREVGGTGLWVEGGDLGWADVVVGPWIFRATNVLKHYREFEMPRGTKFEAWLRRLFEHPSFKKTCSSEELYLDSYERYAFNRPNTSQVANAINSGRGLP